MIIFIKEKKKKNQFLNEFDLQFSDSPSSSLIPDFNSKQKEFQKCYKAYSEANHSNSNSYFNLFENIFYFISRI